MAVSSIVLRSDFSSSRLVRLLGAWAPVTVPPSGMDFAERLGLWLNAFDAIKLQAAHQTIRSPQAPPAARPDRAQPAAALEAQVQRVSAALAHAIAQDPLALAGADPEDPGPVPFQRRHVDLQRHMEQMIGPLRATARQALAAVSPRLGQLATWQALMADSRGARDDEALLQGRHWRYWQVLQRWPLQGPLLADPRPLLQAFGGADALMPAVAYQRFADAARQRNAPFCALRFPRADHQLREAGTDRLQRIVGQDEVWDLSVLVDSVLYVWRRHLLAALAGAASTDGATVSSSDTLGCSVRKRGRCLASWCTAISATWCSSTRTSGTGVS